ncbi:MAG: sigma factor-like helix-turn-helix DNA-binding protein [Candidatus Methanospirareceae archaeon]
MDSNQVTYVLDFFAQYQRYFTVEELSHFADSDSDKETLRHALLTDSRFMQLEEGDFGEKYSIAKRTLFQWFCQLSLKLAWAKQARLSKHQVAILISLRIDGQWDIPPAQSIQFGKQFGFIGPAWTTDEYVFPVAHILSFIRFPTAVTNSVIENFHMEEKTHLVFEELARQLVQDGFSKLSEEVCNIVQAREGLITDRKKTLQQIGDHLNLSRERIRQIENKFWENLRQGPIGQSSLLLFSTALIYSIMSKQGSLIVSQNSSEEFLLSFLAKCTSVPQAELPHTGIVILGASPKDAMPPKPTGLVHEDINIDSIATHLDLERQLCLTDTNLRTVAKSIAQFRRNHLNKGQKTYLALRTIGRRAHCSEITEVYNSLFPEQSSSERNLHAVLSREQYGVVWIGIRSTFALEEWGYEHPSTGLFDTAAEIVREKYEETGQPVPFTVIVAEMGKYRQAVNPSSLTIATWCNPNLQRVGKDFFVPKEATEEIQEDIPAAELDRVLREFEKESDKRATDQDVPPSSRKKSPSSRFRCIVLSLKQKFTSLRS